MRKSKQAKAREFSRAARAEIKERDHGKCIFCQMGYRTKGADQFTAGRTEIMHYIPRSHNGLGIPENGAVGCKYHHNMMDNGNQGCREEMLGIFEEHLKNNYPGWDRGKLVYDKWDFLKGGAT